mmetsp:Transcript_10869/g.67132  ORF Transcript_10869/g.67132 Transcript_10869/m.67132 type:complete len:281 (-) Transcript_10869:3022-3864(-)
MRSDPLLEGRPRGSGRSTRISTGCADRCLDARAWSRSAGRRRCARETARCALSTARRTRHNLVTTHRRMRSIDRQKEVHSDGSFDVPFPGVGSIGRRFGTATGHGGHGRRRSSGPGKVRRHAHRPSSIGGRRSTDGKAAPGHLQRNGRSVGMAAQGTAHRRLRQTPCPSTLEERMRWKRRWRNTNSLRRYQETQPRGVRGPAAGPIPRARDGGRSELQVRISSLGRRRDAQKAGGRKGHGRQDFGVGHRQREGSRWNHLFHTRSGSPDGGRHSCCQRALG